MPQSQKVRVEVNGYDVIGKRVAAAVACQPDMPLAGISDVVTDWRARMVSRNGFRLFGATDQHAAAMRDASLEVAGTLDDLLGEVDVIKEEVLDAFKTSSRIAFIRNDEELVALNSVKELMADRGRPHANLYEVALWADMLRVQGDELFYAYMVDNQAIVSPETIDAIRALTRAVEDASKSIAMTNAALGIAPTLVYGSTKVTRTEVGSEP